MFNQKEYDKKWKEKNPEYHKNWYQENKEEIKEKSKKWNKENPEKRKKWVEENPEKIKKSQKKWREKNREKAKRATIKWQKENPEKVKKNRKNYYQEHIEEEKEYNKKYREENPEKVKKANKEWREKNPEKVKFLSREYIKKRIKIYPQFRLNRNIRTAIWYCLKDKKAGRHWETLVGYTLQKLMIRLEYQFDKNMNWDNYGSYWTIDHKKPQSLFHFNSDKNQAFRDCWCLANLRPLERIENIKKGNKFLKNELRMF